MWRVRPNYKPCLIALEFLSAHAGRGFDVSFFLQNLGVPAAGGPISAPYW
jgi:hypothetical protein